MLPSDNYESQIITMKMKYILMLAVALFAIGAPMAEAAPKKSKKFKTSRKAKDTPAVSFDDDGVFIPATADEFVEEEPEAAEPERPLTGAERREVNKQEREDSKYYIANQKKTLKILRSVRNEKTAAKAVKPLEKIYGEVIDSSAVDGALTALGTVKIMEEDEEKLPVHQSLRSVAAALNQAINKEIARIAKLNIQHKKFNGAMQNMIDSQR
jgi:hypothetical protein